MTAAQRGGEQQPGRPVPKRVAVVFNPAAGEASDRRAEIQAALAANGLEVRWSETTRQDPGRGLTRRAVRKGAELVMVAGGDGTVMACVTGLAGTGVPLAVLPGGTGNLLANNFEIPDDLDGAVEVALHGERRQLDVGALGDDRFVIMCGIGFDAAMLRDADPELKARVGAVAYVLSGMRHLRRRPTRFQLRLDDRPPIARRGQGVLIGNLGRLQGGLPVMPDASPSDGQLDVAVLKTRTLLDWLALAVRILARRRQREPQMEHFRARRVEVRCDRPQPVERDGEPAEPARELLVEIVPGALMLCVPPQEEQR
jgi:YegS/Rv2252/BmrU family lipid kinase